MENLGVLLKSGSFRKIWEASWPRSKWDSTPEIGGGILNVDQGQGCGSLHHGTPQNPLPVIVSPTDISPL